MQNGEAVATLACEGQTSKRLVTWPTVMDLLSAPTATNQSESHANRKCCCPPWQIDHVIGWRARCVPLVCRLICVASSVLTA